MTLNPLSKDELRDRGFVFDGTYATVASADGQITITAGPGRDRHGTAFWLLEIDLPNGSSMAAMVYPEPDSGEMLNENLQLLSRPQA